MNEKLNELNRLQAKIEELENFLETVPECDETLRQGGNKLFIETTTTSKFSFVNYILSEHTTRVEVPNTLRNDLIALCKTRLKIFKARQDEMFK